MLPSLEEAVDLRGGRIDGLLPGSAARLPAALNVLDPGRKPAYAQPPARSLSLVLGHGLVRPAREVPHERVWVIAGFHGMVPAVDRDLDRGRAGARDVLAEIGDGPLDRARRQHQAEPHGLLRRLAPIRPGRDRGGEGKEVGPHWFVRLATGRSGRTASVLDDGPRPAGHVEQGGFRLVGCGNQVAEKIVGGGPETLITLGRTGKGVLTPLLGAAEGRRGLELA